MSSQEKPTPLTKRQQDIRALGRFITPVHTSLRKAPNSLADIGDTQLKEEIEADIESKLAEKGKMTIQSKLYEKLLQTESALLEPSPRVVMDNEHFTNIVSTMKNVGLFQMAKSIELLLGKTKLTRNISDVIISKQARAARGCKGEKVTDEQRMELETYKNKLKAWANKKYSDDCQYRRKRGEVIRPKRSGVYAANKWLLEMANHDLELNLVEPSLLSKELVEGLTLEGNFHGSPEQPDNLLGFQLTASFFYQCLKEIKIK